MSDSPDAEGVGKTSKKTPGGVFLSYASEDADIAAAFYSALVQVRDLAGGGIKPFFDRVSIAAGDNFDQEIREALQSSRYFVAFHLGTLKRSHSYTGFELGYFQALMDEENKPAESHPREIVPIYIGKPDGPSAESQGISLDISPADLRSSSDAYKQKIATMEYVGKSTDPLTKFLNKLARAAEDLTLRNFSDDEREAKQAKRAHDIENTIVPAFKAVIHNYLGRRVERRSIEQKLLEFHTDSAADSTGPVGLLDETQVRGHGDIFTIFGVAKRDEALSWLEFRNEVETSAGADGPSMIRAIMRVFKSAVSLQSALDNDQLIRAVDNRIYRIIVTRHFDYFSGKKVLHMYFIERLRLDDFGDEKTSILLSMVNVAARYRFIFLEPESSLSEQAFLFEHDATRLKSKVDELLRQLVMVEEESHVFRLDSQKARNAVFGDAPDLISLRKMNISWINARARLTQAADVLFAAEEDSFQHALDDWLSVLNEFTKIARQINSAVGCRALDALRQAFSKDEPPEIVAGSPA
ncbi:toll/interleukin-1 receptor domain-containing protein [Methylorubrum extorquens]|uniref:toll/interleukin-1 receptor domain-containing protein n=1 Tax=Methylorubrum extorquens TaxID=408 RepID=UPI0022372FDC|nr:toll/interleukin-1 receptor domain-containing protein [Methylorubrum extorquens]UYW27480.1 toll/interleukin-1 receptor domain-containing protein [Methylorubrum extorquens]